MNDNGYGRRGHFVHGSVGSAVWRCAGLLWWGCGGVWWGWQGTNLRPRDYEQDLIARPVGHGLPTYVMTCSVLPTVDHR